MGKRELKFRAWDKETQEMIYAKERSGYDEVYFDFRNNCFKLMQDQEDNYPREVDAIIMQFTGLKDKNGKEIYECDIVKDDATTFKIEWYKGRFDFVRIKGCYQQPYFGDNCSRMEIIGNIYENPELLKSV